MNGHLLEILAREKAGMPAEWQAYRWECLPDDEPLYFQITGAVAPLGKNGRPNWRKKLVSTQRAVRFSFEAAEKAAAEWSARTGLCIRCAGETKLLKRWSEKDGAEYQPCATCGGTGKA